MAFRVEITPQAFDDLDSIAAYIQEHGSFDVAEKWFNGIIDEIFSLKEMPARCPIAPETQEIGLAIRLLLFGRKNRALQDLLLDPSRHSCIRRGPGSSRTPLGPEACRRGRVGANDR